jgi:hypothetical protein
VKSFVVALLLAVAVLAGACTQPPAGQLVPTPVLAAPQPDAPAAPAPAPGAAGQPATSVDILRSIPRGPERNLFELARRFRGAQATGNELPRPRPITETAGARRSFNVTDLTRNVHFEIQATLRVKGSRAAIWVADGLSVPDSDLTRSLEEFEQSIYPSVMERFAGRDLFASAGGPTITILNATIPGVAGYYSESDAYPRAVNEFSNELNMFFMSVPAVRPGSRQYSAVLAHEFQHMVHAFLDSSEEVWVNEGLSELAADLAGFGVSGFVPTFQGSPQTPLTIWAGEAGRTGPNYGAAYLFMRFLFERLGDRLPISALATETQPGILGVDAYVRAADPARGFADLFDDWVIANRLDRPETGFGYSQASITIPLRREVQRGETVQAVTNQFAAAYYQIPREATRLDFAGSQSVRISPVDPFVGSRMWWSNRADSMQSTLRREFDLTAVQSATLRYSTWFEIERPWDFGYVTVSADGGQTWTILGGQRTTTENPLGLAYGPGVTGTSGGWVEEVVDLSRFAGRRIIVQFEYITDEGVNLTGWLVDNIRIPEIGFEDQAETTNGWTANGFVLTDNRLPQLFSVQVVGVSAAGVERRKLALVGGAGVLDITGWANRFDRVELAIAGTTPLTSQPAGFSFTVN